MRFNDVENLSVCVCVVCSMAGMVLGNHIPFPPLCMFIVQRTAHWSMNVQAGGWRCANPFPPLCMFIVQRTAHWSMNVQAGGWRCANASRHVLLRIRVHVIDNLYNYVSNWKLRIKSVREEELNGNRSLHLSNWWVDEWSSLNLASFTVFEERREGLLPTVHACAKLLDIFP